MHAPYTLAQLQTQLQLAKGSLQAAQRQLAATYAPDFPPAASYGDEVRESHRVTINNRIAHYSARVEELTKAATVDAIPPGLVRVSKEEFFAALKADPRDIMPTVENRSFTSWEVSRTRARWGWSSKGYGSPFGTPEVFAIRAEA